MIYSSLNPDFVTLVTHKRLQFVEVSDFWNFLGAGHICKLMPCGSNPMHHCGVMNVGDSLDAAQSHAVKIHFDGTVVSHRLSSVTGSRIRGTDDRIACTCKTVYVYDDRS